MYRLVTKHIWPTLSSLEYFLTQSVQRCNTKFSQPWPFYLFQMLLIRFLNKPFQHTVVNIEITKKMTWHIMCFLWHKKTIRSLQSYFEYHIYDYILYFIFLNRELKIYVIYNAIILRGWGTKHLWIQI